MKTKMKLSIKEYIEHVGINPKTGKKFSRQYIRQLIDRGKLKAKKEHGIMLIKVK